MADVQFPELARVGTSYELVRPDLGLTIHITEPLKDHDYSTRHEGVRPPFGLSLTNFPKFAAMLDRDPSLVEAVNIMVTPPIPESTIATYTPMVKKMEAFCEHQGYPFPNLSEPSILHFLAEGLKIRNHFPFLVKLSQAYGHWKQS